jgi:uncharacterized protein (TIGR03067 family)
MWMRIIAIGWATLIAFTLAVSAGDEAKAKIIGVWRIEQMYLYGIKQPKEAFEDRQIEFSKEGLFSDIEDGIALKLRFRCDEKKKSPHELNLSDDAKTTLAIYKVEDSGVINVMFGFRRTGKRPTRFDPEHEEVQMHYILKRIEVKSK